MHLLCPQCATSYQLDAASIGAGRSVRCARCKNVWFAAPAARRPDPMSVGHEEAAFRQELGTAEQARPALATLADGVPAVDMRAEPSEIGGPSLPQADVETVAAASYLKTPAVEAPPLAPPADAESPTQSPPTEPEDVESVAARRMPETKPLRRRRTPRSKLPLMILALAAAASIIVAWRKDIVRYAPQMASFYALLRLPVNVRGLMFTDVKIANETRDGVPVLMVEGTIVSVVPDAVEVPRLRFALRDRSGQELYSWTAMPTQTVLPPGETLPFRSRIASPPGDVQDVQVRFFNRRDAAAGLR